MGKTYKLVEVDGEEVLCEVCPPSRRKAHAQIKKAHRNMRDQRGAKYLFWDREDNRGE